MISEQEALQQILSAMPEPAPEQVPLSSALDRFALEERFATCALPGFDNSSMDGYAVRAADSTRGSRLRVTGEQPAGLQQQALTVQPGCAVRIFTGAPVPAGADAVIMQEDVSAAADEILINEPVEQGENIRRAGADLCLGQKILSRGAKLTPQLLALLASQGVEQISAGSLPRVAILTTGDEVVAAGMPLQPGQIYNTNAVMLHALLQRLGLQPALIRHVSDEPAAIQQTLQEALQCDLLVSSGGVSVGKHDHVRDELTRAGAELSLWRVAIKPGKPFLFGSSGRCSIFGLPGNPVSTFVTFLQFVRPALRKLMGAEGASLFLPKMRARLAQRVENDSDRPHYLRGAADGETFQPLGRQESHALYGLARSNALLRLEPHCCYESGQDVEIALGW